MMEVYFLYGIRFNLSHSRFMEDKIGSEKSSEFLFMFLILPDDESIRLLRNVGKQNTEQCRKAEDHSPRFVFFSSPVGKC
jgi:hypothetical protein